MEGPQILSAIVMIFSGFGLGGLFHWMGVWASNRKDPMHFWSGSTVDPKTISNIPAYNQANASMWKCYAVPYWLTGICGILCFWKIWFSVAAGIFITLACTVGIWWLIYTYRKIEKQYKVH